MQKGNIPVPIWAVLLLAVGLAAWFSALKPEIKQFVLDWPVWLELLTGSPVGTG